MKRFVLLSSGCLAVFFCLSAFASHVPAPEETIPLNHTGKKTVMFNHAAHAQVECVECHHTLEDTGVFASCATEGCHITTSKGKNSYYQIIHKATGTAFSTCFSCHQNVAKSEPNRREELTDCKKSKCHGS